MTDLADRMLPVATQENEKENEKERRSLQNAVILVIVFSVNVLTFGLFGLHYLFFALIYDDKKRYLRHFGSYCLGAALLSLGIWCRSSDAGYNECEDGAGGC